MTVVSATLLLRANQRGGLRARPPAEELQGIPPRRAFSPPEARGSWELQPVPPGRGAVVSSDQLVRARRPETELTLRCVTRNAYLRRLTPLICPSASSDIRSPSFSSVGFLYGRLGSGFGPLIFGPSRLGMGR
jgi:hypothetical protein